MFWFEVMPFKEKKWAILIDTQRLPRIYDGKDEAMRAAVSAAEENYCRRGIASGCESGISEVSFEFWPAALWGLRVGRAASSATWLPHDEH